MHSATNPLDIRLIPASPAGVPSTAPGQGVLPLDGNLALAPAPAATPPRRQTPLRAVPGPEPSAATLEAVRANASRFVQALVEVAAGDRSAGQMAKWMTPRVYDEFLDRLSTLGQARTAQGPLSAPRARVVSVHVRKPAGDSAEIAARVVQGRRSRAIALRLEVREDCRDRERWMCTALSWG